MIKLIKKLYASWRGDSKFRRISCRLGRHELHEFAGVVTGRVLRYSDATQGQIVVRKVCLRCGHREDLRFACPVVLQKEQKT